MLGNWADRGQHWFGRQHWVGGGGGQERGGGGGNSGVGGQQGGGSQLLRTALHTINISINLQNSLS